MGALHKTPCQRIQPHPKTRGPRGNILPRIVTDIPAPNHTHLQKLYATEPVAMRPAAHRLGPRRGFPGLRRLGQLLDRLVERRPHHQCRPRTKGDHRRHHAPGIFEAADQLLLPERNPRAPGGTPLGPASRAAEEGLPPDHRFGDRGMRYQALPQPRPESGRAIQACGHLL